MGVRGLMTDAARSMTGPEISSFVRCVGQRVWSAGAPPGLRPRHSPVAYPVPAGKALAGLSQPSAPPSVVRSSSWDGCGGNVAAAARNWPVRSCQKRMEDSWIRTPARSKVGWAGGRGARRHGVGTEGGGEGRFVDEQGSSRTPRVCGVFWGNQSHLSVWTGGWAPLC